MTKILTRIYDFGNKNGILFELLIYHKLTCKIRQPNYRKMDPLVTFSIDDDTDHDNWSGLKVLNPSQYLKPITLSKVQPKNQI